MAGEWKYGTRCCVLQHKTPAPWILGCFFFFNLRKRIKVKGGVCFIFMNQLVFTKCSSSYRRNISFWGDAAEVGSFPLSGSEHIPRGGGICWSPRNRNKGQVESWFILDEIKNRDENPFSSRFQKNERRFSARRWGTRRKWMALLASSVNPKEILCSWVPQNRTWVIQNQLQVWLPWQRWVLHCLLWKPLNHTLYCSLSSEISFYW